MIFSEAEKDKIIKLHFEGLTREQICKEIGIKTPIYISKVFKERGLNSFGRRDKYPVIENYFNDIDNREKAYWLGVMYADGTVSKDLKSVTLSLKDKDHIEKYKEAIGAVNHKITVSVDKRWKNPCCQYILSVKSKEMALGLNKNGCAPNKSLELKALPKINDEYIMDFIRGYFDGDGSIHFLNVNKKYRISFVGTYSFLKEIQKILQVEVKIANQGTGKAYHFQVMGDNQLLNILSSIYKTSTEKTRLARKYKKYLEFCSFLGASPSNLEI